MSYFLRVLKHDKKRELIKERRVRSHNINKGGLRGAFGRGDILTINF